MKQRLESDFRNMIKNDHDIWYLKLQVMPLAYSPTPADFIILTEEKRLLVECKQCKDSAFPFRRLTQEKALTGFDGRWGNHHSFVLLCFWNGSIKSSSYFFVPIHFWSSLRMAYHKKSINEEDCKIFFIKYKISLENINKIIKNI